VSFCHHCAFHPVTFASHQKRVRISSLRLAFKILNLVSLTRCHMRSQKALTALPFLLAFFVTFLYQEDLNKLCAAKLRILVVLKTSILKA